MQDPERHAVLSAAYDAGELFWDTGDVYRDNEDLIGAWFKASPGKRRHVVLATKFANYMAPDGKWVIDTSPPYCEETARLPLKRRSECSAESLRRAYKVHPIAAVQLEYSPRSLDIEHPDTNLLATARELGVAIVAYSPMGRGMLSGQLRSRADLPADDFRSNLWMTSLRLLSAKALPQPSLPSPGCLRRTTLYSQFRELLGKIV
ncbi:hypothetical protein HDU87_007315 [Geranomyces variabilis]|uniref:NADP-dependent oxidoreductase domain-containing protein n=1 Tax=Geranomyces variabilis TaxID=109894 RepID=A0AAD5XPX4_9FUNG|nr:hypothetical protein HDU87_007315 [Geranomyces variabilis]